MNADHQPLPQGSDGSTQALPVEPTNGVAIPGELTQANATTEYGNNNLIVGNGGKVRPNSVASWNVLAAKTGNYSIVATTEAGGAAVLVVDGITLATGTSGAPLTTTVTLAYGLHNIRVKAANGAFGIANVSVNPAK